MFSNIFSIGCHIYVYRAISGVAVGRIEF